METRWMPSVAGILDIIAGVLSLLGSLLSAILVNIFFSSSYDSNSGQQITAMIIWLVLFAPCFIVSLLALIGGIFALRKRVWGLALAGSISVILTIWAWPLGVASVIFISLSKSEFDQPKSMFQESIIPPSSAQDKSSL